MIMSKNLPLLNSDGFIGLIGLHFTKFEKGISQCELTVTKQLLNPHNVVHGGVLYSMADTGMGGALYSHLSDDELCATVEIKINYFKAVKTGHLICNTKLINVGKRIAVLESDILNDGVLVSKATGTYSIFKKKTM